MQDINKLVLADTMAPCEAEAYLSDLEEWSEETARRLARSEGIELTDTHMEVICFLRDYFSECGPAPNARTLLRAMEENYWDQGGRKFLYSLFPRGPVTQGCRFAGVPTPAGNKDLSFGSVH